MTGILTVGGGRQWESDLVAALDRSGAELSIVRRCADMSDLLAVASTGRAAVAVVDGNIRRFDSESVERLRSAGVAVVAVSERGDPKSAHRLGLIGVAEIVDDDVGADRLAAAAGAAAASFAVTPGISTDVGDPRRALPHPMPAGPAETDRLEDGGPGGIVVAVWGPTGAPGRTTVAMGFAEATAGLGMPTLLVDADVYGGVLANAFALLDESPGLAGACRLAANGRLTVAEFERLCWSVAPELTLLTGISRPDRWPEVRPSAVPQVLQMARTIAACTVVDCGFALESDEELSYDTVAPRRNGATLAVLRDAEVLIAVGSADPPGMERLIRGLGELTEAMPHARPKVVLNRVRSTAAGFEEAAAAVRRFTGLEPLAGLPEDRKGADAAWARGAGLAAASPSSPMLKVFRSLAHAVVPAAAVFAAAAVPR